MATDHALWRDLDAFRLICESGYFDPDWYVRSYPDVAAAKVDPALHYLRYGAEMGRDPGPGFGTLDYLRANPDVVRLGLNPLVHFVLHGNAEGRAPRLDVPARHVAGIRRRMQVLGLEERALADLHAMAEGAQSTRRRRLASREIALAALREGEDETALDWIAATRRIEEGDDDETDLDVAETIALHRLGRRAEARALLDAALVAGRATRDLHLAATNDDMTPEERLRPIAAAMEGLAPPALHPGDGAAFDRLHVPGPPAPVADGPRVSVILAAHEAKETLGTALCALTAQSWRNLQIIVVDDASEDGGATLALAEEHRARDPRIEILSMPVNGGAYAARNLALSRADGTYVTLHDADDWSHPARIEWQVAHLEGHPNDLACTVRAARATPDLRFPRWAGPEGSVRIMRPQVASLMLRRAPFIEEFGRWDDARFGADSELIRRIRTVRGVTSVSDLDTPLMALQRLSEASGVSGGPLEVDGYPFGARLDYLEAQLGHHERLREEGRPLAYGTAPPSEDAPDRILPERPYPVPAILLADRRRAPPPPDLVLASDFRLKGGSSLSNQQEIEAQSRAGLTTGLVQMYRYDMAAGPERKMLPQIRDLVDGERVRVLVHGESVECDLLVLRYPPVLQEFQMRMPQVRPRRVKVIVNQPPRDHYGEDSKLRYDLLRAESHLRRHFGVPGEWHPIGPLVREALHTHHAGELGHIDLRPEDWVNIIDVDAWDRGLGGGPRPEMGTRGPGGRIRIGRHSRDNPVKWPADAATLLAAYPDAEDLEIRVLGGAESPRALLDGGLPGNWHVTAFGKMEPRDFLAGIDVFVYYAHPDWVESFGRTIIEAMAVGVPTILPEIYRPVFGEASLYASPEEAPALARRLCADRDAYSAQVRLAQGIVRRRYGFETHLRRLAEAGAVAPAAQTTPETAPR